MDAVARRRRRVKEQLVAEAGGRCILCGYDRSTVALHFHHTNPGDKHFGLAMGGLTKSIEALRSEARKCVLLCANCHSEVEWGVATLPEPAASQALGPG
jgi:5-methylcytosine-specific restriction endonuclease McrA